MADMTVVIVAPGTGAGQRVPVLACADRLRTEATVEIVEIDEPADLDPVLAMVLPPASDGAADADPPRLVVVGDDQAQAVVLRRMVRRMRPTGGDRKGLRPDRTIPDLPPVGILPLDPTDTTDLAAQLGLARQPSDVADAVLGGRCRRLDLLRTDAGGVAVHGAVIGAADEGGRPVPFTAMVEVDGRILATPGERLLAVVIANAGHDEVGRVPMTPEAAADDGDVHVAVALPVTARNLITRRQVSRVEVRRVRGRAVAVAVGDGERIPFTDDGLANTLSGKRSWWIERAAWGAYVK